MIAAGLPEDEIQRLAALYELLCLDTPPEERFDRIVQFASDEFDAPVVLLSLIDRDRQWFKAKIGMDVCETARDVSFCSHAILSPNNMIVQDAKRDPRFFDNPLVTSAPHVRFYAGAPLELSPGCRVGTLCILDTKPRTFDEIDHSILRSLRDLIVQELRMLPSQAKLNDPEKTDFRNHSATA
jgi:GAF domain-containing protein